MRTLDSALTTSQEADFDEPYILLTFTNRANSTSFTYATDDSTNKIVKVQQTEGRADGKINMAGVDGTFSMIIRLRDADNSVAAVDHVGFRVDVGWGFNTASGNKVSTGPPGFVINQREVSVLGNTFVELTCLSVWDMLARTPVNIKTSAIFNFSTDTVRHILMETLMGDVSAAIADDGGVFTDETTDANDPGANDVALLPASPATNDAFYIGSSVRFDRISIDLTTVGVGTWTITWEFWNGSSWSTITDIDGNTTHTTGIGAFKTGELQTFAFDAPSSWATTTINSQGPFFYVRARVSAFTSITTQPLATRITIAYDWGVELDTSDSLQGDDTVPIYQTQIGTSRLGLALDMIGFTLLGIRVRQDGIHLLYIDNAQGSPDYSYVNSAHNSYSSEYSQSLIIPNKVIVNNSDPALGTPDSEGSDEDSTSVAAIGTLPVILVVPGVTSNAEAATQATRAIKRALRDSQQGTAVVPMNCGQEIWDQVQVTDQRTSRTFKGRVSTLVRTYIPSAGVYNLQIQMGGVAAVSTADYPNRIDLMTQAERNATRAEEDARLRAGVPPISRKTIDILVDERLEEIGLGPLRFPEEEGIDLPFQPRERRPEAVVVDFFRSVREQAALEGEFLSISDVASLFTTGLTAAMQAVITENTASTAIRAAQVQADLELL